MAHERWSIERTFYRWRRLNDEIGVDIYAATWESDSGVVEMGSVLYSKLVEMF
jgi:hypothetical protein